MQEWVQLSEIVRNFGLVAAGIVGVAIAALRVRAANRQAEAQLKQAEVGRRELAAELFLKTGGQLDDPKLHVRLAAIYTLRRIKEDFPDLAKDVTELLSAHLREMPPGYGEGLPPPDVREIMRMLRELLRDER